MPEKKLLNKILVNLPNFTRLFRNNVGTGWVGKVIQNKSMDNGGRLVTIANARPLKAGLIKGSSDLIGWSSVKITPDMVGKTIAVFTALEVKTGDTATSPAQKVFIRNVKEAGGIANVVKSTIEAIETIEKHG